MKRFPLHGHPRSRREFISQGLLAGGGLMLAPTLLGLLTREALATSKKRTMLRPLPFLVFDLAGGAALPANFLVGKMGGPKDLLKNYDQLGWDPKSGTDDRFGLPMAPAKTSGMLAGILSVLSSQAQANLKFSSFAHTAQADTDSNPLSALQLLIHSGLEGRTIPALGTSSSTSGGASTYAGTLKAKPIHVSRLEDISRACGLSPVFQQLPNSTKSALSRMLGRLSSSQSARLLSLPADENVLRDIDGSYTKFQRDAISKWSFDPRQDTNFAEIYGFDNSESSDPSVIRAGLVMGALSGETGPCAITIDGCDYHDGTQTTGDEKDREIGIEIGRAVEAAHRLKTPLFFQIITDGGVYAAEGTRNWMGDSSETCMTVVGYYNPVTVPTYFKDQQQIGFYTDNQGAARTTLIGESPFLAAHAVLANYLSVQDRLGEFTSLAPNVINPQQLDSLVSLAPSLMV